MASRRKLKKSLSYVAGELFCASFQKGVDRDAVIDVVCNVLNLVPRVSHTEPGNVKNYYKQIYNDLNAEVGKVVDLLNQTIEKQ